MIVRLTVEIEGGLVDAGPAATEFHERIQEILEEIQEEYDVGVDVVMVEEP